MKYYIDHTAMPILNSQKLKRLKLYIGFAIFFFGLVIFIKEFLL